MKAFSLALIVVGVAWATLIAVGEFTLWMLPIAAIIYVAGIWFNLES